MNESELRYRLIKNVRNILNEYDSDNSNNLTYYEASDELIEEVKYWERRINDYKKKEQLEVL